MRDLAKIVFDYILSRAVEELDGICGESRRLAGTGAAIRTIPGVVR